MADNIKNEFSKADEARIAEQVGCKTPMWRVAEQIIKYGFHTAENGHERDQSFCDSLKAHGYKNYSEISEDDVKSFSPEDEAVFKIIGMVMDRLESGDVLDVRLMHPLRVYSERESFKASNKPNDPMPSGPGT